MIKVFCLKLSLTDFLFFSAQYRIAFLRLRYHPLLALERTSKSMLIFVLFIHWRWNRSRELSEKFSSPLPPSLFSISIFTCTFCQRMSVKLCELHSGCIKLWIRIVRDRLDSQAVGVCFLSGQQLEWPERFSVGRPAFLESLLPEVSIQLRIWYPARSIMSSGSSSSDRAVIRSRVVATRGQQSESRTVSQTTTRVHPSESRTVTSTRVQPVESRTVSHTTTRVVKQVSASARCGKTVTETTITASKSSAPQVRTVTRTTTRVVASPSKKSKVGFFYYS